MITCEWRDAGEFSIAACTQCQAIWRGIMRQPVRTAAGINSRGGGHPPPGLRCRPGMRRLSAIMDGAGHNEGVEAVCASGCCPTEPLWPKQEVPPPTHLELRCRLLVACLGLNSVITATELATQTQRPAAAAAAPSSALPTCQHKLIEACAKRGASGSTLVG